MLLIQVIFVAIITSLPVISSFTLVSDLNTPAFLIDMDMLHKAASSHSNDVDSSAMDTISPIYLPKYNMTLYPYSLGSHSQSIDHGMPYPINEYQGQQSALGYIHSSVIRSRDQFDSKLSSPSSLQPQNSETHGEGGEVSTATSVLSRTTTLLAELDVGTDLCPQAQLVMGINNHHVGSYYWARSAGMGASMETPGILFRSYSECAKDTPDNRVQSSTIDTGNGTPTGVLCWDGESPFDCNSNDGKRSEWVNFLRCGDLVQLLPDCLESGLVSFVKRFQDEDYEQQRSGVCTRIYGFSSKGRPLGSEPKVVCQWSSRETDVM